MPSAAGRSDPGGAPRPSAFFSLSILRSPLDAVLFNNPVSQSCPPEALLHLFRSSDRLLPCSPINTRFAYVAVSRASHDAQIYTDDAGSLGKRLSNDVSKSSAVEFHTPQPVTQQHTKEPDLDTTSRDHTLRPEDPAAQQKERIYSPADHERHYASLNTALHPEDAKQFGWKAETGTVQSYMHGDTHRHIHIDGTTGQFYDQQRTPITQEEALDRVMGPSNHHASTHHHSPSTGQVPIPTEENQQSISI